MRRTKTLQLAGRSVTVGEPTMEQIWSLLQDQGAGVDVFALLTGAAPIPPDLLGLCTDLRPDDVGALHPSELREVVAAVREVGLADFFGLVEDLAPLGGLLARPTSPAPSASSSGTATPTPGATAHGRSGSRWTSWLPGMSK